MKSGERRRHDASNSVETLEERIVLKSHQGAFLKRCPCTASPYLGCGYWVLNAGLNCSLGCDYCILQAYLDTDELVVFDNPADMFREVKHELSSHPERKYRIGTGELMDSLLLDNITGMSHELVLLFSRFPNAILELKTKTTSVANLEGLDHRGRTVVAWSLSPQHIIRRHEGSSASLAQRLAAAQRVIEWGYPVAFHFDPVLRTKTVVDDYRRLIDLLFSTIPEEAIRWISLGSFRYTPELAAVLLAHPRKRRILCDEFVRCPDGKFRYFWPLRVDMLAPIAEAIRTTAPSVFVYLCMERARVWRAVLGWSPRSTKELANRLDARVFPFSGLPGVSGGQVQLRESEE